MNENLINQDINKEQKRIIKFNARVKAIDSKNSAAFFALNRQQKEQIRDSSIFPRDALLRTASLQFNSKIYFDGKYLKYLIKLINESLDGEEIHKKDNAVFRNK